MKVKFNLNVPPFSINKMYYATVKTRTKEARLWSEDVLNELKSKPGLQKTFKRMRDAFDPAKHSFHITLKYHYPKEIFYTVKGYVSAGTMDQSNVEKPLIDLLFLPKYGDLNLGIDDRYITSLYSEKVPCEDGDSWVSVMIKLVSIRPGP